MSEEQTEAAAIEGISKLISDDNYNIGQAEETEANPEAGAEPKQETQSEEKTQEPAKESEDIPEAKAGEGEPAEEEIEVEIKGQKYKAPKALEELIMFQADYTKKTMALAEERKALDAQKGQIDPNITAKLTHYEKLLGDAVLVDQQTDWVEELRKDPIGAMERKYLAEQRAAEWQQTQAKNQQEFAVKMSQAADKEWGQLIAKRPDLKEAAAFKAHDEKVRSFLSQQGYEPKDIDPAVFDHRVRLIIEDAIKYRELDKAKAETVKKIEKLPPKVERPGVPSGTDSQGAKSAMQKLRSTGKIDDAAAALSALMG